MKYIITAGGTGGHLFPAQALAQQLQGLNPKSCIFFAGGGLSHNKYFDRAAFSYVDIATAKVSFKKPLKTFVGLFSLLKGYVQSRRLMVSFKPDVVIGFGSFTTYPVLLAAKHKKIPIVLHEANAIPGLVNRLFAPTALFTGIFFPETKQRLTGKTQFVKTPLRMNRAATKEEAYAYFGLTAAKKTLLIFGGSQGAMALNDLMVKAAPHLRHLQLLHFTGHQRSTEACRQVYKDLGIAAVVKDFESRMDFAWQIADVALTRSGSSTIAEQFESEVPAIFVPYPFATDRHQHKNAEFVEKEVGGGIAIDQNELNLERLMGILEPLMRDEKALLAMKERIRRYKAHHSADFAQEIVKAL